MKRNQAVQVAQAAHDVCRSSHHAYSLALALQAVQNIAERASDAWLETVDMGLVVQCAKEAPDSAVRNAALTLLGVLATKLPDSALQHVLVVLPDLCTNQCVALTAVFNHRHMSQPHPSAIHYRCHLLWPEDWDMRENAGSWAMLLLTAHSVSSTNVHVVSVVSSPGTGALCKAFAG